MRNIKDKFLYIIASISIVCALSGCHFLEVEKLGKSDIEGYFKEFDGLKTAMYGAYSVTYDFYDSHFSKYAEVAGNMTRLSSVTSSDDMVDQYNFTSSPDQETTAVGYIWKNGFIIMSNVNNILYYAPGLKKSFPNNLRDIELIEAQALFLRALTHLDITLCYGQHYTYTPDASHLGIPVLTRLPAAGETILRNSVKEVYDQILSDLNKAIEIFGDTPMTSPYYASADACKALLSRVYLYMEDWDKAEQYASEVIPKFPLTPREKYAEMYHNPDYLGSEAIFRLSGYKASTTLKKFYDPTSPVATPADTLFSLFDNPDDVRLSLLKYTNDNGYTVNACTKFYIPDNKIPDEDRHYDPFVLRSSEMYLNRAEARCKKGNLEGAASDLKTLIARATGLSESSVNLTYSNSEELMQLIVKERVKELCFEGHNFFDITRRKSDLHRELSTNSVVRYMAYPSDYFVLPIPQIEMDSNIGIQPNPTVNN